MYMYHAVPAHPNYHIILNWNFAELTAVCFGCISSLTRIQTHVELFEWGREVLLKLHASAEKPGGFPAPIALTSGYSFCVQMRRTGKRNEYQI